MQILHQNATSQLLEKIKSLGTGPHSSWRCIHIHLSDKPERYNHGLRAHFVARAMIGLLSDIDGYLFLCDDGDIFLLFQGQVKPILRRMATHFDDLAPDLIGASQDGRFTIYDLGTDWQALYLVCHAKVMEALTMPEGFYAAFAYSMEEVGSN